MKNLLPSEALTREAFARAAEGAGEKRRLA